MTKITKFFSTLLIAFLGAAGLLFASASPAWAAARTASVTGNWNNTATWGGSSVPVAGDTVTINSGITVTVTADAACTSLTFTQGTSSGGTVNINSGIILTVSGAITIPRNSSATNTLAVGAGILNAGSISFTNGGTTNRHQITISTGTVTVTGNIVGSSGNPSGTISFSGAGTLKIGGTIFVSGDGTLTTATGSTVEYNAAGAQTVQAFAYNNLTLSGSGAKTLTSGLTVGGNLTLNGTATATTVAAFTVGGNLTVGSGTIFATGTTSTYTLTVTGTTTVGGTLTLANTGNKTFTGNVTVNSGGTWNETGAAAISFAGNLQNDGTFTASTGAHTFTGTARTISGANVVAIPSLTISGTTTNNGILTVSTTLAGSSTLTNGTNATLNFGGSSITPTLTATATGNTVNYTGAAQTVKGSTYNNLTLSGSGAKTTTGATVNGILSLEGTATTTGTVPTYGSAATLQYKGSAAQTTGTEFPATFGGTGGIIINNASGVTLNSSAAITNGITLTAGTFAVGAHTLTLNGPAIAGTASNLTTTSSSILVFGGSSTGVSLPSSVTSLSGLTVNNANGLTLNSNPTISGSLTLTSGKITTGANNLIIGSAGTISGGSASAYVYGNLQKTFATGTGLSFTYPIGDATVYAPISLASLNVVTAGNLTAKTTGSENPNIGTSTINAAKSVNRYYTLTSGGGLVASTYGATFNFVGGDVDSGATPANFIVGKYDNSTWTYPTVGTKNSTNTQITGVTTGFSDFAIGEIAIQNQTITVTTHAPASAAYNATFPVAATATSGLTVAITTTGGCSIASGTVTMTSGTTACVVHYNQAGNGSWNPAPEVTETTNATLAAQATLTAVATPSTVVYGNTSTLSTTGGSGTGAVTYGVGTSTGCSVNGTTLSVINASGTCAVTATKAADSNYNSATSAPITVTLQKATQAALTVTGLPVNAFYGQAGITAGTSGGSGTGLVSYGAGASTACSVDSASGAVTITNASGTCSITATKAADTNYNSATSGAVTIVIGKADQAALTVTGLPASAAYGQTGIVAGTSGGSGTGAVTFSASGSTACSVNATTGAVTITLGTGTCSITATKAADTNYNAATSAAVSITITKADATIVVTPYNVVYDGLPHTATGLATGVDGGAIPGLDLSMTTQTNPGTYPATWQFYGGSNYKNASGPVTDVISMVAVTVTANAQTKTYGANDPALTYTSSDPNITFTGALTRAAGEDVGTYAITQGTLSAGANTTINFVGANLTITKADAIIVVTPYTVTYDGLSHTATGTATGTKGEALTGLDLSGTTQTNAGTYNPTWQFYGGTNYNNATGTVIDTINKATATVTLDNLDQAYDGTAKHATATTDPIGYPVTFTYDGSATEPVAVGSYAVIGTVVADNYTGTASGTLVIGLGTQTTLTVTGLPASAIYGQASITAATSGGSGNGAITFSAGSSTACQIDPASGAVTINSGTGICDITATKAADANYNAATSAPISITIAKADQAALTVTNLPASAAYGQTGIVAHADGGTGTGAVTFSAGGSTACTVDASTGAVAITVAEGTCSITATKATDDNYNVTTSAAVSITVGQASVTIVVTPYNVTYDGTAHTATGTATGPNGEDLSAQLELDTTTQTDAGTYTPTWYFWGGTNYANQSGTITDTIAKADATINVTPYNVAYDGLPHTATGAATGVKGADLSSSLDLSGTTQTLAGTYTPTWSFNGGADYNSTTGTITNTISKAAATVTITNTTFEYDGTQKPVTVTTDPVGLTVTVSYNGVIDTPPSAAGDYPVVATVVNANYQGSATATLHIGYHNALNVKVVVDNTNGGTATPANFIVSVSGANANPSTFPGADNTAVAVDGNTAYAVSAAAVDGYTASLSGNCTGPTVIGNDTCTITEVYGNLIKNFDVTDSNNGTAPNYWITGGYGVTKTAAYPVDGPNGSSDKAVKMTITDASGGGAAEWVFDQVAVEPGALYTYSDSYNSDVSTIINLAYATALGADPSHNEQIATLDSSAGTWKQFTQDFTVPAGYNALTVYHLINSVGNLTADHFRLVKKASAADNQFPQGMVTLSFDDGWAVHYDNSEPILDAAGFKGTFNVVTQSMLDATAANSDNLLDKTAYPDVTITQTGSSTTWANIYTDPSNPKFRFTDTYTASVASTVAVTYTPTGSVNPVTITLGTEPVSPTSSNQITQIFTLPDHNGPISIVHSVSGGTLTIFSSKLTGWNLYMDESQVLALQADGNEISSHTVNHCNLATGHCPTDTDPIGPADTITSQQEVNNSRTTLLGIGAIPVQSIAYPHGGYNASVEAMVQAAGYIDGRTIDPGFNTRYMDKYALKTQTVTSTTTLAQVQNWIDTAVANKWWLILTFHEVGDSTQSTAVSKQMFSDIVNYLKTSGATVKTTHDIISIAGASPETPVAAPGSGSYGDTQNVTLTSANATSIHYTTDGTTPTCSGGHVYTAPVQVSTTTNLQAVGCNVNGVSAAGNFVYTISRAITVTADAISIAYGDSEPALTYKVTSGALLAGDAFTGSLVRDPGTNVGTYAIKQGTLALNNNYVLTFVGANLTIGSVVVNVTASGGTMVYGSAAPAITATYSPAITPATPATCLTQASATSNVGDYASTCSGAADPNYTFSYTDGAVSVTKADLSVVVDGGKTKNYGEVFTAFTGTITGIKNSDNIGATYASDGAVANAGIGSYDITATLNDPNSKLGNYNVTNTPAVKGLIVGSVAVSVAASSGTMVYGGTVPQITATYSPAITPATPATCLTAATATSPVASYASTCSGAADPNYTFTYTVGSVSVTPAALSVKANDAARAYGEANPVFDGTITGIQNSDPITATYATSATQTSPVGTYDIVPTLVGDTSNYTVTATNGKLTVGSATVNVAASSGTMVYGGTVPQITATYSPAITPATPATCLTAATATSPVASYASTCSGAADPNYTFTYTVGSVSVTPASLTVAATADNKPYDGTVAAVAHLATNAVNGDNVIPAYTSAVFADKNIGTGKTVTVSGISITGADIANYNLVNTTASAKADITSGNAVTATITASNKVYDGSNTATIATRTLSGVAQGDDVSLVAGTATFSDKNVGTGKTVTETGLTLTGADAVNYTLTSTSATALTNITAKDLSVTATADNKPYDGNTNAVAHLTTNALSGDTVAANYTSATFADKNIGNNKTITVSGISIGGTDAANYNLTNTAATATASITSGNAVTATITASNKVYDGSNTATILTRTLTGVAQGDDVRLVAGTATFSDKNAGTGKTVTETGLTLTGADAANYTLTNSSATTLANITPAGLTITAQTNTKVYDGNTSAAATPTVVGLLGTDTATGSAETYDNANVGTGKTLTVSAYTVNDGNNGGNYIVTTNTNTTGVITANGTTVALISDGNPSTAGQTVTFSAAVSDGPQIATGSVTFTDVTSAQTLGSGTLDASGKAIYATGALTVGQHVIKATYNGDATHSSADSNTLTQTVNAISGSVTVTSSANPSTYNQAVTFTATVPTGATGTIQFMIDGTNFGTPVTIANGTAVSGSTSTLSVGTHPVTAGYSGDATHSAATGTLSGGQVVNQMTGTVTVSSSVNPSTAGQAVTFTATLPSIATGTIQFMIDGTNFGTPVTIANGTAASQSTTTLSVGNHPVTAIYPGDANYAATSGTLSGGQTVNAVTNHPPVASNVTVTTAYQTSVNIALIATDQDPSDQLTFAIVSSPSHGTATLSVGSSIVTYVPATSYSGSDSFTYKANDGKADSNIATVSITVQPPANGSLIVNKVAVNGNGTFTFTGNNGISGFSITTTSGAGSNTINNLTPGTYTITEGTLAIGWAKTSDNCSNVTVTAGKTSSCTVINTYTAPVNNLVPNPSVETVSGSVPQNWTTGSWGTNTTTFTYLTTGHTGTRSVKVQMTAYTSGDAKWYFTPQTVTAGTVYNVSDYYESNITSHFMIQFQLASGSYQYTELATAPASSTAWRQYTGTVTAPANAVNMTIFHLISAVGWLTTDDYSVTTGSTPTTGSLVVTKNTVGGDGTFSMTGSGSIGSFSLTTVSGTKSQTFGSLTPGTFSVTETVPSGWTQTSTTCGSVAVTAGNTATCTITNTKNAPTTGSITVTKTAVNGNGTFNFTGSTGISAFAIATTNGTGSNTINGLTPGTYTITEGTLGNGWTKTADTCGSIVVTAGNTATCAVTNTYTAPATGSITVTKTAVNGNGIFNFTGNNGISAFAITTANGTGSNTINGLTPGTYTITEGTLGTGWVKTADTCGNIAVTAGNTATCAVTNTYTAPPTTGSITVTKTAVNGNGTFNFTGSTGISAFSITTTNGTGSNTISNLTPGTYTITEGTLGTGWAKTVDTCGSVVVAAGNTATCGVTNTYTAPPTTGSITVTKTAVNGNGTFNFTGSTGISAFAITTTNGTGSNTINNLTPGTYTITEGTLGTGWAQTSTTCSSVVVTSGNTATCTVTNTYTAPPTTGSIKITKTAVNGNGTFNFTGSTGISSFAITTTSGTGTYTVSNLTPGTYTITEGTLGTGWAKTADTCGSVVVTAGNTAACAVTNTYTAPPTTGSITVTKTAVNGNGTFNFTGSTGISAFAITTTSGTGTYTISNLTPGTYTITETTPGTGWAQTSTTCSSVVVTAGNTATCAVTNTYTAPPTTGSIKVTKTAVNGNGTFNFTGSTGISAFSITTTNGTGSNTISNLTPGTYTITEGTLGTGWAQTSTTCSSVTVTAGNTATCTVTNTYTASTNLVPNSSVETASGSAPLNWLTGNWGTNTTTFTYLTTGHTGTRSVKVQMTAFTSGDAKWYFTPQTVTAGKTYSVSDWYESNITSHFMIQFQLASGSYQYTELATAPASSTAWRQYTGTVTAPANAVNMTIFHLISAVGWLTTDDYSVIQQ